MSQKTIEKILDKLLKEEKVVGYSIKEGKIIIYVEDEEIASQFKALTFAGYETEVKVIGRLQMF